ncbi:hypothetical protein SMKI_11G0610 [Saccharomyces mikatae IFO 1815]|uniref:Calcipressin n=1 Tax=Saccharomyces mikatae IFO 1815 TaxID=226126 RepID=A0AA35IR46_SACMI|nr:uncharacterized protein SMKI_11G0610 [Saccharomyces mikatae IFO 1815]CAI4034615.1 hypothetical protein SMKI_11G0610 [Saccharomyces mikatae IFO 1815]
MDEIITDTIIITSSKCDIVHNDNVGKIQAWLCKRILMKFQINENDPIQLIILKRLKRILLICPNHDISRHIMNASHTSEVEKFNFNYSLQDGHKNIAKQYLKVPESEKMFLISPPASPPPEFDFTKCEDAPQRHVQSCIQQEQQQRMKANHLLPKGPDKESNGTFTLLKSKAGAITIDRCPTNDADGQIRLADHVKTAFPPKSIFDSDNSDEEDETM